MRKVVVEVYTSLDGVIQPLDWMPPSETGREERGKYARDQLFAADALLLGRDTYEIFANTWPFRTAADEGPGEGGYVDRINSMPKYVASRTLQEPLTWNATLIKGDVVGEIKQLKQTLGGNLLQYGVGELTHTLLKAQLVDEVRFLVFPFAYGKGPRIFEHMGVNILKLVETKTFSSGVIALHYEPQKSA